MTRRARKWLAAAMLLLNVSGGRVYASCETCQRTRVFYGPSLAFKMVAKSVGCAAARAPWRRADTRSFGHHCRRVTASDLATLRGSGAVAAVQTNPGVCLTLAALPRRAPPQTLVPLSSELGTAPPLHTRK